MAKAQAVTVCYMYERNRRRLAWSDVSDLAVAASWSRLNGRRRHSAIGYLTESVTSSTSIVTSNRCRHDSRMSVEAGTPFQEAT